MTDLDATPRAADHVARAARPPVAITVGASRAVFTWRNDRWSTELFVGDPATSSPIASPTWTSLEGPWPDTGDARWPASPVMVELTRIDLAETGAAVLGVGMAGRSHFSASIARDPHVAEAVRFEIACRLHDGPGWLGSSFLNGPRLVRIEATAGAGPLPRTVVWSYSIGPQGLFGVMGATVRTHQA